MLQLFVAFEAARYSGEPPTWIAAALASGFLLWHLRDRLAVLMKSRRQTLFRPEKGARVHAEEPASPVIARITDILFHSGKRELQRRNRVATNLGDVRPSGAGLAERSQPYDVRFGEPRFAPRGEHPTSRDTAGL